MTQWFHKHFKPYMTRPMIYKTFTRFIYALLISLLWDRFINDGMYSKMHAFLFFGVFYALMGWISFLKLDGVKMPNLTEWLTSSLPRRKPERAYGDMSDYVDENVVSFEELEDEEKVACVLFADVICCLIFILLSFIPW